MKRDAVRKILMGYFSIDENGHHRPIFIADCDMWDELFKELFERKLI